MSYRMENEIAKQQHRIDKILSPQFSKNTHLVLELRREIEKSVLVRQLKAQMLSLRATITERDETIEAMQKSSGASHLMELTAEKEEYFGEVKRLERLLAQKDKELESERQSHAWEKSGTSGAEGDLRDEIDRLSKGYQKVLDRLEEKVGTKDHSQVSRPESTGGIRPIHQSRPQASSGSRPKSASSTRATKKAPTKGSPRAGTVASESAMKPSPDPSALDCIDPVLISFDDRKHKHPQAAGKTNDPQPQKESSSEPTYPSAMVNAQPDNGNGLNYSLLENSQEETAIPGGGVMEVVGDAAAGWLPETLPMGCRVNVKRGDCEISGRVCGNSGGANGTYAVEYDDGSKEQGVARKSISIVGEAPQLAPVAAIFSKGEKVEGNYKGSGSWYAAKVVSVNADGTYTIEYDDGDMEHNVLEINLAALDIAVPPDAKTEEAERAEQPPAQNIQIRYEANQPILGRYKGNSKFYPGKIKRANGNGTYDILYDDGEEEHFVSEELIKAQEVDATGSMSEVDETAAPPSLYSVGTNVEARFRGRAKWFPGVIVRVREGEQYDIDYFDGEQERRVPSNLIRRHVAAEEGPSPSSAPPPLSGKEWSVGERIEADYGNEGEFFPGIIRRKESTADGYVYDIEYDDGDNETRVSANLIKDLVTSEPVARNPPDSSDTTPVVVSATSSEPVKPIVPEDDLNDFLAGLSDDDDGENVIGAGLDAGGSQYEGGQDEYGEDFED